MTVYTIEIESKLLLFLGAHDGKYLSDLLGPKNKELFSTTHDRLIDFGNIRVLTSQTKKKIINETKWYFTVCDRFEELITITCVNYMSINCWTVRYLSNYLDSAHYDVVNVTDYFSSLGIE